MGIIFFQQRVKDLEEHVAQAQALISGYEEDRDLAEDRRTRARCEKVIKELKTSVRQYLEELEELQRQLPNQENKLTNSVSDQLANIEYSLRVLMDGQVAILRKYDDSSHFIVAQIIDQLNQNQLQLTHSLLNGLEGDKVTKTEAEEALVLVERRLTSLTDIPSIPLELTQVIKNPNLDARHRLKVCIPIIPLLLDYEGEIELGTGFDFQGLWDRIKVRLRK